MRIGKMVVAILLSCVAVLWASTPAQAAACIVNWPWEQPTLDGRIQQHEHKAGHLLGSAAVTAGVTWYTQDVRYGVAAGLAVGAVREIYKASHANMSCEWSSISYDLVGVALGAYLGEKWLIVPKRDGVQVMYSTRF